MSPNDLHNKPFTEETITKLEIFEKYLEEWLPVFIYGGFTEVYICDFFAGKGQDSEGIPGSPLRILNIIDKYKSNIQSKKLKVNVLLNEFKEDKFLKLQELISCKTKEMGELNNFVNVQLYNEDFVKLFDKEKKKLDKTANLIFIDQSGIKFVTQSVLLELDSFTTTDFMFFISSSYLRRFPDLLIKIFPNLESEKIKELHYYDVHRMILQEYRELLLSDSETRLYPFSIQKKSNIYGLIFGAKHPLAIDKFLKIAWNQNKLNGEANFDIDEEAKNMQGDLFTGRKLTKIEKFEQELEIFILNKREVTNNEIYDFTLEAGHIPEHANKKVREMREKKKLDYPKYPNISYDKCYKEKESKIFRVI